MFSEIDLSLLLEETKVPNWESEDELTIIFLEELYDGIEEHEKFLKEGYVSQQVMESIENTLSELKVCLDAGAIDQSEFILQALKDTEESITKVMLDVKTLKSTYEYNTFCDPIESQNNVVDLIRSIRGKHVLPDVVYVKPITRYGQKTLKGEVDWKITTMERIETLYGYHTYGCDNQEEYDAVIEAIDEIIALYPDGYKWTEENHLINQALYDKTYGYTMRTEERAIKEYYEYIQEYEDYFENDFTIDKLDLYPDYKTNSKLFDNLRNEIREDLISKGLLMDRSARAKAYDKMRMDEYLFLNHRGVSLEDLGESKIVNGINSRVHWKNRYTRPVTIPEGSQGESAFDRVFGAGDCNSMAYLRSAILDRFGFNTRISYSVNHAWCEVYMNGAWYRFDFTFTQEDQNVTKGVLIESTY